MYKKIQNYDPRRHTAREDRLKRYLFVDTYLIVFKVQ